MIDILFPPLAAFLAGLIKTTFGVGAGVFLTPLLALSMDAKVAVALMAPMMLSSDISSIGVHWNKWDNKHFKYIIPGGILGVILGSYYLAWASLRLTQLSIGVIAIFFSLFQIARIQRPGFFNNLRLKPAHGMFTSVIAGLASAVAHSGGIVMSMYLVTLGLNKHVFVATLIGFLFANDIIKLILFSQLEILTVPTLIYGIKLIPILFFGSWLGGKLINKLTPYQFIFIINFLIFISGVILVVKSY